jgi:hypothetical protein
MDFVIKRDGGSHAKYVSNFSIGLVGYVRAHGTASRGQGIGP